MALNPYSSIFGLTEEEDEEEALRLAEDAAAASNPYFAIFSPAIEEEVVPPPEPVAEAEEAPSEPSWFDSARGIAAGVTSTTAGAVGAIAESVAGASDLINPFENITGSSRSAVEPFVEEMRDVQKLERGIAQENRPEGFAAGLGYDAATALGQMLPTMATFYATRNPNLALSVMGGQVVGSVYEEKRGEGWSTEDALGEAIKQGAYEVGLEKLFKVFDSLGGLNTVKRIVAVTAGESGSEATTEILNLLEESINDSDSFTKFWDKLVSVDSAKRTGYAALLGGILGVGMAGPGVIADPFVRKASEKRVLDASVPNIPESLAAEEANLSLDPNRAQVHSVFEDRAPDFGLPDVDIDLGPQNIQRTEVGVTGNVTMGEGSALKRVKELAAYPSKILESADVPLPVPKVAQGAQAPKSRAEELGVTFEVEEDGSVSDLAAVKAGEVQGAIEATVSTDGTKVRIKAAALPEELRGGTGTEMYRRFFDEQLRRGRVVESDYSVTEPAFRIWNKLAEEGYNVEINPTVQRETDSDGNFKYYSARDGGPVATIRPQQAVEHAEQQQEFGDDGVQVEELTPEQLEQELGQPLAPVSEPIVADQAVETPDVAATLNAEQEIQRLSGEAPAAPQGPLTVKERQEMREFSTKEIEVRDIISSLASVGNKGNIDLENVATVSAKETPDGIVLTSQTGSEARLTSQDVKSLRYADLGSFRQAGLANYLRLKIDTMGFRFRGQDYNPHFRRTKTSKIVQDLSTETIRTINSSRVGVQTKLEILNTQWERASGQQIQDAPREQLQHFNAFLTGNMGMDQLQRAVDITPEIVRNLTSLRKDIDILSRTMVAEGMIDNELAFQIDNNVGTYLRVQYALKDVEARMNNPDALLKLIPEEKRNMVMRALNNAYLEPALQGQLHLLPRASLKRLAQTYGLLANKVVGSTTRVTEEGETVPVTESRIIVGTNIDIDRAKASDIAAALQERLAEKPILPNDIILGFLQGGVGGAQASMHGREKSAERARTLSRTEEQLRKEGFTEEEIALNTAFRMMLSEHLDPVTTIQMTVNTMLNHIASHRIVNSISQLAPTGAVSIGRANQETGATQRLAESGDKWADVRVIDPETGESVPASEVYVRPEVRLQFDRLVRPNFSDGLLTNIYRSAQAMTKVNLTALNAGSHFRNARSSLEIAAMRGYLLNPNMKRTMNALRAASTMSAHEVDPRNQQWTEEALDNAAVYLTKLGILHDSVRTGPIKDILQRMNSSKDASAAFDQDNTYLTASGTTLEDALHKFGKTKAVRGTRKALMDTPLGAYRMEDEGPKILAFIQEREMVADMMDRPDLVEVMQGKRKATAAERTEIRKLDQKAAKKIRNLFPTYSSVPEFVKDLSANLFATPFPSFNAEMIRNWAHDIRDIADMAAYVKGGDQSQASYYQGMNKTKVAARLVGRLWSWSAMGAYYSTILSSVGFAFGWMMSLPFGATPDDEDEVTKKARELTEKIVEHGYVPGKTELDVYDPFFRAHMPGWGKSNLYRIVGFEPGKSMTVMDMSYTMPYSQITQLGVNLGGATGALIEGDVAEAARATESGILKFVLEWAATEPLADAVLQLYTGESEYGELEGWERTDALTAMLVPGSQTYKSIQRLVAPSNDPHAQSLADFAMGQRPFELFFDKSYVNAIWPEKLKMRKSTVRVGELIRDAAAGTVNEEEFRQSYQNYEEDRIRAMAQIEFLNYSSGILGFTKAQRRKAIAESTLTGDNRIKKADLLEGGWHPLYFSPGDIYPENQLPDPKLTREYRRWIRIMGEVQQENNWR